VSEDDDDGDEEEEDDIFSLPRALLEYSITSEDRVKSEEAAKKAATVCLSLYPELSSMLQKAKARADGKVPPGSSEVKRDLSDNRFLLCQIFIAVGKHQEMHGNLVEAKDKYSEALICFPKSVEGNLLFAKIVKALATTEEELKTVEKSLKKATSAGKMLGQVPLVTDTEAYSIYKIEMDAASCAAEALYLFLCQEGRFNEADKLLLSSGYKYRLSDEVFHYSNTLEQELRAPISDLSDGVTNDATIPMQIVDEAVDPRLLDRLSYIFRENGPFWTEHDYCVLSNSSRKVGYFSYMYPMKERKASNVIEQLIDTIFAHASDSFPELRTQCNYGTGLLVLTY
jgi:hypothetical protein